MDKSHQTVLRTNRVYLVRNLIVQEELLSFLLAKRILSEDMAEEIKELHRTKAAKAGALLDLLPRRGPHAFRAFIEGLVETDQGYVADMLDKPCGDRYRAQTGRPQEDTYPEGTPVHRHQAHIPEQHRNNKVEDNESFIKFDIMNVDKTDGMRKNNDSANYEMKSKPRGRCIILNIDQFSAEANQKDRYGSNFDVVNLTELFKNLLFDVKLWANLTKEKILAAIDEERKAEHHQKYDAFIMIILSHGHEGIIYSQDGKKISIDKDIVNQFNGAHCKHLVNKPKLFFIQACQGNEKTIGVTADGDEDDAQVGPDDFNELMKQFGGGGEDTSDSVKQALDAMTHEQADIYVAYATVPGYKAWRHTSLGSWFMRDLVTVFAQYCHMEHVADMLTRVNQLVDARMVDDGKYRQICRHVSQLRRRVYLLPGYFAE